MLRLITLAMLIHCAISGAEVVGIWMGETTGRNGERQDIAFQFKATTGVMFGDEIDLPVEELKVEGDKISFSVTSVNYYSGSRATTVYSGAITGQEMHLTRERKGVPAGDRENGKQEIILKRVTSKIVMPLRRASTRRWGISSTANVFTT